MRQRRAQVKAPLCEWDGTLFLHRCTFPLHFLNRRSSRWWFKRHTEQ